MEYSYNSPLGVIRLVSEGGFLTRLDFPDDARPAGAGDKPSCPVIELCAEQLDGYFAGVLTAFTVPVKPKGTAFQADVWRGLTAIPYGQTRSYKELAAHIGRPGAARAVGGANHANPIYIIIPCHRVIGADGSLSGYGGGIWRKEWLLNHEKSTRP